MRSIIISITMCCAAIFGWSHSYAQQVEDYGTKVKVGQTVPSFEVTMVDGSKINIADLRGKVVVLNFWATWCPPCRAEFKRVPEEIIKQFQGQEFMFLPISRGETAETVNAFCKKQGYTFPIGLDPKSEIFGVFAARAIPRNFIIDRNGVIVACEIGYSPEQFDSMINEIKKLIKN